MNLYDDIKKRYTDNPLIDEIVYECQQIIRGIVVKDEDRALKNETKRSIQEADIYNDIIAGTLQFNRLEYSYSTFMKIPFMSPDLAILYANGEQPVPDSIKALVLQYQEEEWLKNYQETNNYYRRLWGKPDWGEDGIFLTPEQMLQLPVESYDNSHPVHDSSINEASLLYQYGIIDELKAEYPEAKYLDYLGEKSINPITARHAVKFSLLYMPSIQSSEVANKWKERYEINRVYVLKTIYSEAYKYQSEYYDRIMMVLIIILTLQDMINYSPEYIISRDLFDMRTIQYIFEACGVEFFPEIPLKYQKRLVKNLNRLIKYKSSNKCLVDIASLFGFENIEIFKYYLMRIPKLSEDGKGYQKDTYIDPKTGEEILNLEANYNLKFLRVPIDGIADDYINDPLAYEDYDNMVKDDIYWNGIYSSEYVKHKILEHEFSINISKYISIDTIYSLTELQFEMVYFINMLLYSKVDTQDLLVEVPELSLTKQYPLVDLLSTLYSLMYLYNGVNDTIVYDPIQALDVCGFNFETDLDELKTYVVNQGFTLEEVGLDTFKNPNPIGIHDWETLIDVYESNKALIEKLVYLMNNANDYDEYSLYRKVYQSLFVTKLSFDMFTNISPTGKVPTRYIEYLKWANTDLFQLVTETSLIINDEDRINEITKIINYLVEDIYTYLDKDEFRYMFQNIPTVSLDYIRKYLFKVLNFFKSYKTDIIHTNIIYRFDDKLENKVYIIDKLIMQYNLTKKDWVGIDDAFKMALVSLNPTDIVPILENIRMDISRWTRHRFFEYVPIDDRWWDLLIHLIKRDDIGIEDVIGEYKHVFTWTEYGNPSEDLGFNTNFIFSDRVSISDYIDFTRTSN